MKTVSLVSNLCDFLGFIIFYQEIFIHYLAFCIATLLSCFKYWLRRSQMVIFFSFFEILFYAQFPQAKVWYWVLIWYFFWKNREKWNVQVRENMKQKFRGLLEFQQQVDFFEDQVLFPCHMSGDVTDNWKKKCEGPFPVFVTVPWLQFQTTKKNCIQCVKITKKMCQIIERWTVLFHSGVSFIHYDSIEFWIFVLCGEGRVSKMEFCSSKRMSNYNQAQGLNKLPTKKKILITCFLE